MGLFKKDLKKEIQRLSRILNSPRFKIPDNWTLWDHSELKLHLIEEVDLLILRDITKLQKRGGLNQELSENIFRHSYKLYLILAKMLHERKVGKKEKEQEAEIANRFIEELVELIDQTRKSIDTIADTAIRKFNKKFGEKFLIEIGVSGHGGYDITIRLKTNNQAYIDIEFSNRCGYIHMINVDSSLRGKGIGTELVLAIIFIIKELDGNHLGAHVTHIGLLKIYATVFGRNNLGISYEEAEKKVLAKKGVRLFMKV